MNAELTKQELDVLFDAVEKWEEGNVEGELLSEILENVFRGPNPIHMVKMKLEREDRVRRQEIARKERKERGVIIRAKLLTLKNSAAAESLGAHAKGNC